MPEIRLPIDITYNTAGVTPIKDVIVALQAADVLIADAVSLLPSLLDDVDLRLVSISVQKLSQESPLKEIIIAALFVAAQQSLEDGVVTGFEALSGVDVAPSYRAILTVAVLLVTFYGVALAKDLLARAISEGPARRQLNALISDLAQKTDRSEDEVRRILEGKYSKAGPVKTLVRSALSFFIPSKREGSAGLEVGDVRIEPRIVDDVPFAGQVAEDQDFERFKPYNNVTLELHAQDMDKTATGWAAVPTGISERRLRLKLMSPVEPAQLWGKSKVRGDVVIISKITAKGFEPSEIHLTSVEAAE